MEIGMLRELRKKQFIVDNCVCIIGLALFFLLLYVGVALNKIIIFLGIVILLLQIFENKYNDFIYKIFPYMKKLSLYEENKLGRKWNILTTITTVSFGIMTLLLGITFDDMVYSYDLKTTTIRFSLLLILINVKTYLDIKKMDDEGSSLNKYIKRKFISGIFFCIFCIVINICLIFILFNKNLYI